MNRKIKISSFGGEYKDLLINDRVFTFNNRSINLNEVVGIRYGVEGIRLEMFTIGVKYIIDLKSDKEHLCIILKSYFGFSKPYFNQIYADVLKTIWKDTAIRLTNDFIDKLEGGQSIEIGKCILFSNGIKLSGNLIPYDDVTYQKLYNRLTVNCKSNLKIFTNIYYTEDYNVDILISVLDWIYKYDGIKKIKETSHRE